MVTWVSTSAIVHVWSSADPKMVGFFVALLVAFTGYFLKEKRTMKKLVVTPFNGLLIYLTIMGGTSFLPPPQMPSAEDPSQSGSAGDTVRVEQRSPFLSSWSVNETLVTEASELKQQNQQLELKNRKLNQLNTTYRTRLDSTRRIIENLQLSPDIRNNLMRSLEMEVVNNQNLNNLNGLNQ